MEPKEESGGTKIGKRGQNQMGMMPPQQMGPSPQQMAMSPQQMAMGPQQMGPSQQQMGMGPQQPPQYTPEQIAMIQQQQQMMKQNAMGNAGRFGMKSKFGSMGDDKVRKYTMLVVLIFILLNSKIIWTQLSKLPFMGSVEPSIIALIVNSLLAGVVFFVISSLLIK